MATVAGSSPPKTSPEVEGPPPPRFALPEVKSATSLHDVPSYDSVNALGAKFPPHIIDKFHLQTVDILYDSG